MYFKLAWREFKKNLFMRIIIILQIAVVLFCVVCASSIAIYFYTYYNNFKSYFNSNGILYHMENIVFEDYMIAEDSEVIEQQLKKAEVISCYMPWVSYENTNQNEIEFYSMAYDKEFIDGFTPKLSDGRWLNYKRGDGIVEAVISKGAYDLQVGDTLTMYDVYMHQPEQSLTVEIVGEISDGERIVGFTNNIRNSVYDYQSVYCDFYADQEEMPVILLSIDNINTGMEIKENHSIERMMTGLMFVRFSPDITHEEQIYNERILGTEVRTIEKNYMSDIRQNSFKSMKERIFAILPIFLCVFILTIISATISCSIAAKKQMRDYTIYGVCGMQWNKSILITVLDCLYTAVIGIILCFVFIKAGQKFSWFENTMVDIGILQFICVILVGMFYIIVSAIMPYALIKGTSLNDELRRGWND